MQGKGNEIKTYKMFYHENPEIKIDFNLNIIPYTEKHQHDFWEIIVMCENDCINVVNGIETELKSRDIQILRPNDVHYFKKIKGKDHLLLNLEVKTDFFENMFGEFCSSLFKDLCGNQQIIPKFKCGRETFEKLLYLMHLTQRFYEADTETPQFLLKQIFMLILFEIGESFYVDEINNKADKSFSSIMVMLFNQPENIPLKLHEVCKKYPCSVEYAIRRFKEEGMDETPNMIFRKIKLGYACKLLKTSDLTILDICGSIGFNHLGYFNKVFREEYGISPKEYRKRYRYAKEQ